MLVPETQLFQIWQCENEQIRAQETLRRLQRVWEARQLRLMNFILYVPYEPPALERSKRQMFHSPQWEVVSKDSGTFILSGETQLLLSSYSPLLGATFVHHIHTTLPNLASLARAPSLLSNPRHLSVLRQFFHVAPV